MRRRTDSTDASAWRRRRASFTLADASGTSSSAYSALLDHLRLHAACRRMSTAGRSPAPAVRPPNDSVFADGGSLENMAILPCYGARSSAWWCSSTPMCRSIWTTIQAIDPGPADLDASFAQLFGQPRSTPSPNQVFSQEDFVPSRAGAAGCEADRQRRRSPRRRLDVQAESVVGHRRRLAGAVSWVYNDRVPNWESRLPPDLRALIDAGQPPTPTGPLVDFPHYKTDFENRHELVQLTAVQAEPPRSPVVRDRHRQCGGVRTLRCRIR